MKNFAAEKSNLDKILAPEDNSGERYEYESFELPLDEQGFAASFDLADADGIRSFFAEHGLVVVRDVLTPDACERSVDELWAFVERQVPTLTRSDPRTWERWPSLSKLGILGNTFVLSPQFCRNRQDERVHRAFATVFGTEELLVNVGRASAMRPTRGVRMPATDTEAEELVDKPEWKSTAGGEWLHWDVNPFTGHASSFSWRLQDVEANRGYDRLHVQAILALDDCRSEDGGFFCVPNSHRALRGWAHAHLHLRKKVNSAESSCQCLLPRDDPLLQQGQRVPIRAGSLLIWNAHLAHCNYPNDSDRMRLVQYIQMVRADDPALAPLLVDSNLLPPTSAFELTALGRKLHGFEPWPKTKH